MPTRVAESTTASDLSASKDYLTTKPFERFLRTDPKVTYVEESDSMLRRFVIDRVERLMGRGEVDRIYQELKEPDFNAQVFFKEALERGNIKLQYDEAQLAKVPATGPVVFVANHPFGIIDGLGLCNLAMKCRGNFQILIHAILCQDKDLLPHFLPIDFTQHRDARKTNIYTKRVALQSLENDVPILIFPSGGIATADKLGFGEVEDRPWTTFAAKLIQQSGATVIPCFFHGRNSRLFQFASYIAEPLRLALLLNEIVNKFDSTVGISIGDPITSEEISELGSRADITKALHAKVWNLQDSH